MELKNVNVNENIIDKVEVGSIADELGIKKGDILISINDVEVKDIIDYKYLIADEFIILTIRKENEIWEYEIEKDYDEDIGITFTNPLIDNAKSCLNKCSFCFIDQLPKGMRETLYFKDDDSRLSFLQGNFITLTNMSEDDIDRIIKYRISPINISVHTTNPDLRIKMLKNKNAGKIYEIMKRFYNANIEMNCQIVLCPGLNDGYELDRTIEDLKRLHPSVKSVALVPVGLTKYREGLQNLKPYDYMLSRNLIDKISGYQVKYLKEINTRFVFIADEFYLLANRKIPKYFEYEDFPQLENGIGLIRKFMYEIEENLKEIKNCKIEKKILIATGTLAYRFMKDICKKIENKIEKLTLNVVPINNEFFGETITVVGLITGRDLINQLRNIEGYDELIIPSTMLRNGEAVFLDDITIDDVKRKLNINIIVSDVVGKDFINKIRKGD